MKPCIMCKAEFKEEDLDFIGRCTPCFRKYMAMSDEDKPNLGVPFMPGYASIHKKWGDPK